MKNGDWIFITTIHLHIYIHIVQHFEQYGIVQLRQPPYNLDLTVSYIEKCSKSRFTHVDQIKENDEAIRNDHYRILWNEHPC